MAKDPKKQIVQRINKNFLDILILRLISEEPMWGYKIIKKTKELFGIKLRHGTLYPLLNSLEADNQIKSNRITYEGRVRKVYNITSRGIELVETYYEIIKEQLQKMDLIKEIENERK